jgi:hypothetical protein
MVQDSTASRYQPGQVIKNDIEHILFFRKGGQYRG